MHDPPTLSRYSQQQQFVQEYIRSATNPDAKAVLLPAVAMPLKNPSMSLQYRDSGGAQMGICPAPWAAKAIRWFNPLSSHLML